MPFSCEDQHDFVFVGGVDHFLIVSGTARFDDSRDTGGGKRVNAVSEWEKSVRGSHAPRGSISGFDHGPIGRPNSRLVPCPYTDSLGAIGDDNRV